MCESDQSILSTLTPALFGLLGVLIGSGIHFVGLLFDRKWKREQKVAERYEEYAHCLNEALLWFQRVGDACTPEEMDAEPHSSETRKMVMVSTLYFPELKEKTVDFSNFLVSYKNLLIDCFDEDEGSSAAVQAIQKGNGKFEKMGEEVIKIRTELDNLIDRYSKKYAKV